MKCWMTAGPERDDNHEASKTITTIDREASHGIFYHLEGNQFFDFDHEVDPNLQGM